MQTSWDYSPDPSTSLSSHTRRRTHAEHTFQITDSQQQFHISFSLSLPFLVTFPFLSWLCVRGTNPVALWNLDKLSPTHLHTAHPSFSSFALKWGLTQLHTIILKSLCGPGKPWTCSNYASHALSCSWLYFIFLSQIFFIRDFYKVFKDVHCFKFCSKNAGLRGK